MEQDAICEPVPITTNHEFDKNFYDQMVDHLNSCQKKCSKTLRTILYIKLKIQTVTKDCYYLLLEMLELEKRL